MPRQIGGASRAALAGGVTGLLQLRTAAGARCSSAAASKILLLASEVTALQQASTKAAAAAAVRVTDCS